MGGNVFYRDGFSFNCQQIVLVFIHILSRPEIPGRFRVHNGGGPAINEKQFGE